MKTPSLPLLAVLCLCLFITGCNRAPSTAAPPTANSTVNGTASTKNVPVSGQVFIVTEGGENIKLGAVEIRLADAKSAEEDESRAEGGMLSDFNKTKDKTQKEEAAYQSAMNEFTKVNTEYKNADSALHDAESAQGVIAIGDSEVDGVNPEQAANIVALDKKRAEIGAKLVPLRDKVKSLSTNTGPDIYSAHYVMEMDADLFFATFSSVAKTETDADGRFTLSVPEGSHYVIAAQAERSVGDKKEKYYWLEDVDLTSADNGLTIMLTNDNKVEPLKVLNFDSSTLPDELPELSIDFFGEIIIKPASFKFENPAGEIITPEAPASDASSTATTSDAGSSNAPAPTVPVWTPPDPWPKQDNWTWKTTDKTYENVVITGIYPHDNLISFIHSGGITQVYVTDLPPDIQKMLNYPPAATQASTSTNTPSTNAPSSVNH